MGGGSYSLFSRSSRAEEEGYYSKPIAETFKTRRSDWKQKGMCPEGVVLRESRDSEEHPRSVPIIIGLDVTGSMMSVPEMFIRDGMPNMMSGIIQKGIADPQVMFLAIGDHECDTAPLQVGQFESSDELLDRWLTSTWLERGGGGNYGESYLLAWYFAGLHTVTDHMEKRGKKGYLFTIGDEPCLERVPEHSLLSIMGKGQYQSFTARELLELAQKKYHVFHFHVLGTTAGQRYKYEKNWGHLLGQDVINVDSCLDIPKMIADIVVATESEQMENIGTIEVDGKEVPGGMDTGIGDDQTGYIEIPGTDEEIL